MGTSLGRLWAQRGHEVRLSFSRDEANISDKAAQIGATAGSVREAVENSDLLLLSVPWELVTQAIEEAGDLSGKILVTCCTPLTPDFMDLTMGTNTSGAETIQALAPGARVVESFNSVFATIFESGDMQFGDRPATVFYCGDEDEAKKAVAQLIEELGCDGVDAGPLSSARYLEPAAVLILRLASLKGRAPTST
jgi:predicted dinucleotide-binding enzyme